MKVVLLAGGLGTRISEESHTKPKPMIEIGGKPILWHIMKIYSHYGFHDFVICAGYKSHVIKNYFANYYLYNADVTFDLKNDSLEVHQNNAESWKVTVVDTGEETLTGGRIKRIARYVGDQDFFCTYGDGVGNVNLSELLAFHRSHGKLATLTATMPPGRYGVMNIEQNQVTRFHEKPEGGTSWINGGFFIFSPGVFNYISGDQVMLEREPLENLARDGQLFAFQHNGFWQPMDTLRDKNYLEELWSKRQAPWKIWRDLRVESAAPSHLKPAGNL